MNNGRSDGLDCVPGRSTAAGGPRAAHRATAVLGWGGGPPPTGRPATGPGSTHYCVPGAPTLWAVRLLEALEALLPPQPADRTAEGTPPQGAPSGGHCAGLGSKVTERPGVKES